MSFGAYYKPASTKAIITIGFSCVFALMITVVWVSLSTVQSVNSRMAGLIQVTDQKTSTAHQMREAVRNRSSKVRELAQNSDPEKHKTIFTQLVNTTKIYKEGRQKLISLESTSEETAIVAKLVETDERIKKSYDRVYEALYSVRQDTQQANQQASAQAAEQAAEQKSSPENQALQSALKNTQLQELVLLNHLNELVQLEKEIARNQLELNQKQYTQIRHTLILISAVALFFGILISVVVTSRVSRANSRIAHLASHDDLTGLINRREFEIRLSKIIATADSSKEQFGLMYIDLDRFKIVNDTCGHHAGDRLLVELATLITESINEQDIFARIGGDEFAIIARATKFQAITEMAETLRSKVHDYVFTYANQNFSVSLSIGVIPLRGDVTDLEAVLTNVDSACYLAKQSGRNRVHIAQTNDENIVKYRNDIAGIQVIRHALNEGRMVLYYQPVYAISDNKTRIEHCEVLLRIVDSNGDLVSPGEFIPLAEKYNIMTEIDKWVLENALDWVRKHQQEHDLPRLLVNLSGLSIIDKEFLDYAVDLLQRSGINLNRLAFEITETAAVDNLDQARDFMMRLRKLGCRFALDDFGSGFSTFAYLKNLPIDYLKIDGTLVRDMAVDTVDREMVKAINEVGHVVGARTIAEFVEDDAILRILRELGVDYAQGFGLQKPRELDYLTEDLANITEAPALRNVA